MCGEMEYGTCEVCGKKAPLSRKYRRFDNIDCECHGPHHFDMMRVCKDCEDEAKFPSHTTLSIKKHGKETKITIDADILSSFKDNEELIGYLDMVAGGFNHTT